MSREWMEKTLIGLGFTETDADVYIHLASEGPKRTGQIATALKLIERKLDRILKKLQNKGIVEASQEYPYTFSAVSFDRVLDLFIKANLEEAKSLMQDKQELLSTWRSITEKDQEKS